MKIKQFVKHVRKNLDKFSFDEKTKKHIYHNSDLNFWCEIYYEESAFCHDGYYPERFQLKIAIKSGEDRPQTIDSGWEESWYIVPVEYLDKLKLNFKEHFGFGEYIQEHYKRATEVISKIPSNIFI